jgi:subtilisin family serine protease/N-acetylneuraminic acid mutarotase
MGRVVVLFCGLVFLAGSTAALGKLKPKPSLHSRRMQAGSAAKSKRPSVAGVHRGKKLPPHQKGEAIVRFRRGVGVHSARSAASSMNAEVKKEFRLLSARKNRQYSLVKSADLTTEELLERLRRNPNVEAAWPNYIRQIDILPNDPSFGQLWGLHNTGQPVDGDTGSSDADIDAPEAWDAATGGGIVVADIDTGVDYTHVDLEANMWVNPGEIAGNGVDDDLNGYIDDIHGIDSYNGDTDPMDDHGHGTHTSGTIAAVGDNGIGITGVSWDAKIMAVKSFSASGYGNDAAEIEAIEYVVALKNAGVNVVAINASWGGSGGSDDEDDPLRAAIALAGDAGIVFCAAAGNDYGNDNDGYPHYPSSYSLPNIIAIAATDQDDGLANFSNYGPDSVDIGAPGDNIYSTVPGTDYVPAAGDIFFDDMESGVGSWIHGGTLDTWALSGENVHGGVSAWSDSPGTSYADDTNSWLAYNADIDLSAYTGQSIALGFWAEVNMEGCCDYFTIEMSGDGGATWAQQGGYINGVAGWQAYSYLIPDSYKTSQFRFRFRLDTDYSITYNGVHIDDVGIGDAVSGAYEFNNGTSMATPHVTGAVALMAAAYPAEGVGTRVNRIYSGVDPLPSLAGKVTSGGRLNIASSIASDLEFRPLLTGLTPAQGLSPGTTVTLSGSDFGPDPGKILFLDSFVSGQRTSQFRFRFRLVTDDSWNGDGILIDDVRVGSGEAEYFFDDTEGGALGWISGGTNNNWMISAGDAHSPTHAWSDSSGSYTYNTDAWFGVANDIDLSGTEAESVTLGFWAKTDLDTGDYVYVETSPDGGVTWYQVGVLSEVSGWGPHSFSIPGVGAEAPVISWSDTLIEARVPEDGGGMIVVEKVGGSLSRSLSGSAWSAGPSSGTGRDGAATVAYDGKIYLFGGYTDGGYYDTGAAEVFAPSSGWSAIAPLPATRANMAAAVVDGKIYLIGGDDDYIAVSDVYAYDPAADSYEVKASLPIPVDFASAVSVGGKVYLAGGSRDDYPYETALHSLYVYDPAADTWTQGASMMEDRMGHGALEVDGKIYVFGGMNDVDGYLSSVEIYDPDTNSWNYGSSLPMSLARMGAASDGRLVYLVGGTNGDWWDEPLSIFITYDPATGISRSEENSLRNPYAPRAACGAVYLEGPGSGLYAVNGSGVNVSLDSVERLAIGEDLVLDFGAAYGVWSFSNNDQQQWKSINAGSPELMATGDFDGNGRDDAVFYFGPAAGVWAWYNNDPTSWVSVIKASPEIMTAGDLDGNGQGDILFDFGAAGVWVWYNNDQGSWSRAVDSPAAEIIAVGDLDGSGQDDVIVDLGPEGVWAWYNNDPGTLSLITSLDP